MTEQGYKVCWGCGERKALDDFHRKCTGAQGRTARCKPCAKVYQAAHRDPAKERERGLKWRAANRERMREYRREWAAANRRKLADAQNAWRAANRDTAKAWARSRYAVKRGGVFVEHVFDAVLWERDGGLCGICGNPVDGANYQVDHVVPVNVGGEHSYANTQLAHPRCNRLKSDSVPQLAT